MKKAPVLLHPEQEAAQKQSWERMEGEKAADYMRFRTFLQLGIRRTLQAVAEQEGQSRKARKSPKNESAQVAEETQTENTALVKKVSVSGSMKQVAKKWRWRERAEAWDDFVRLECHKEILAHLDHEAEYVTRAQRLDALDVLMKNLMRINMALSEDAIMDDKAYKRWLAMHRQMVVTIREIRREMAGLDKLGATSFSEIGEGLF